MEYNFKDIEKRWRETWAKEGTYRTEEREDKEKFYVLNMFPYPSGAGLHVGHPLGYSASDIYARDKRLRGYNVLNPALVARAFLFFSYPSHMSGDSVWIATPFHFAGDAVSGATPLGQLMAGQPLQASALDMFIGTIPGSTCETSVVAILLGALLLLATGIASWRIMLSVVVGGGLMGLLFNAIGANEYMQVPFYYHYLMGGFAFGCVFMATDPVTAAQTNTGKWIYGFLIGAFAVLLRVLNPAYPEGMMLAILLMNCFAPLIDHCVVAANIKRRQKRWQANMNVEERRIA